MVIEVESYMYADFTLFGKVVKTVECDNASVIIIEKKAEFKGEKKKVYSVVVGQDFYEEIKELSQSLIKKNVMVNGNIEIRGGNQSEYISLEAKKIVVIGGVNNE